jgi:RNA polymerase sigma-70 factor (ECF subfamily)
VRKGGSGDARALVAGAIRGEAPAVRTLWERHRRWVAAILLAHKPREVELEDLLQEVAMSYVRTIGELRDEGALKPWLRTIAINAARAAGRRSKFHRRQVGIGDGCEADGADRKVTLADDADGSPVEREEAGRLLDLARSLPEGYREPLLLRCARGMSYRTISELMGLPESTIETRIARGRRMLRELANESRAGGGALEIEKGGRG